MTGSSPRVTHHMQGGQFMLPRIHRILAISALAATGIVAGAGSAHAAIGTRLTWSASSGATATLPSSKIEGTGRALRFVPKSITAGPTVGTCSSTNYSFLVINSTMRSQQIIYMGMPLGSPITPKQGLLVCANGAGTGSLTVRRDPKAKLSFTIT
jgi:hypothetical protein